MLFKLAAVAAAGAMAAIGITGSAAAAPAKAQTHSAATASFTKEYLYTTRDQWTHWTPDAQTSSHAGTLYQAVNYFYCWVEGAWYSNGYGSNVWLRTDDDSGYRNVYVSDVNLTYGDFVHDKEILPHC
ncbi:hypothetical protein N7U49_47290 [Streptomyces sp. AD2-2]|nr:hypothetical protein N7U49_47290 [Streptomyces sp. AD2-2]